MEEFNLDLIINDNIIENDNDSDNDNDNNKNVNIKQILFDFDVVSNTEKYKLNVILAQEKDYVRDICDDKYSNLTDEELKLLDYAINSTLAFSNIALRKNDKVEPYEKETDQAASIFFRWVWEDSKAEIYGEFNHNDSKFNFRDL